MKNNQNKSRGKSSLKTRLLIFYAICSLMAFFFVIKLLSLQVFGGEEYVKRAVEQRRSILEVPPERGTIYDTNGEPLAISVKENVVYLFPEDVGDKAQTAESLSSILNLRYEDLLLEMEKTGIQRLAEGISNIQADALREVKLKGVAIVPQNARFYPSGDFAPYVLGFLDHNDHGAYGIERSFDEELFGQSGIRALSVSPLGDVIPFENIEEIDVDEGNDVVLTIDSKIQELVTRFGRETFDKYKPNKLTILVMNPKNGDVLALENYPKYNPNRPRDSRSEEEKEVWRTLTEEELLNEYYSIWRSPAINDIYEPGSVFKFITAAAAVEEGTATDHSVYHCDGVVTDIPGVVLKCYRWYEPHGDQSLTEAMNNSCNPAFIQIARELGKEKLYKYIQDFGFGSATGIRLPAEAEGLIPGTTEEISEVDLAVMSYGHGVAVTPIQMITAISAVVNGGDLYEPRIAREIRDPQTEETTQIPVKFKRQVISEATSARMRELMVSGVLEGTADGARIRGYNIGGKTGTSVKFVDDQYEMETTVASYVGIYPAEDPEYIVLAVADEPQGASSGNVVSAPLVKKVLKGIIDIRKDQPTEPILAEDETGVEVPYVIGLPLASAVELLNEAGLTHSVVNPNIGKNSVISNQAPEAGSLVDYGSVVDLQSDVSGSQWIQMPELVGLDASDARSKLDELRLGYDNMDAIGVVSSQEPLPGVLVDPDSKVIFGVTAPTVPEEEPSEEETEETQEEPSE